MPNRSNHRILGAPKRLIALSWLLAVAIFVSAGCSSKPSAPASRFHLHGKIVSVNLSTGSADVDHDAIPGYMEAMTMPYAIPDEKVLSTLSRSDEITADVVVVDGVPHLENVVVVKHAAKSDPAP
jgi:protein SCO1